MAEPFVRLTAVAAPLLRDNIDTDAIIPSREMRSVSKDGLADGLFAGWRYTAVGGRDPNPSFVLNQPRYAGTRILLAGENFGCGSSREHAAWALAEYGIRAIIAPSFNVIFRGNCVRNGIVPVVLGRETVAELAGDLAAMDMPRLTLDLEACFVEGATRHAFVIDAEAREMLLHGLDPIALTLRLGDWIEQFRAADRTARPWVYF